MTIANASQVSAFGLPPALRIAQEAISLPEVQEMLRRLSKFKLGIFMPHMHDEQTGEFRPLQDDVTQVESSLQVSFHRAKQISDQTSRFLPVGWCWRDGVAEATSVCEMDEEEGTSNAEPNVKHKMMLKGI